MAEITAAIVKELRERTGSGMMDCKKALAETNGDMEKAIDYLREKGLAKAAKKAERTASDGRVFYSISEDGKRGVMIELNSETDFVAKTDEFNDLGKKITAHLFEKAYDDPAALLAGGNLNETLTAVIAKLGEKQGSIRKTERLSATFTAITKSARLPNLKLTRPKPLTRRNLLNLDMKFACR